MRPNPEDIECFLLVEWLNLRNIPFTHVNNEMFTRSWMQKMRSKKMGVSAGFPDYVVIYKGRVIFLEMKRKEKSLAKVSPSQKKWLEVLKTTSSVVAVCYGFDEARALIESIE